MGCSKARHQSRMLMNNTNQHCPCQGNHHSCYSSALGFRFSTYTWPQRVKLYPKHARMCCSALLQVKSVIQTFLVGQRVKTTLHCELSLVRSHTRVAKLVKIPLL
ncbi:hypothetical protein XELAEV_18026345mg [Xenopus laevis]|uniref:Uncharacterized protein n=1 Tax=Xenopus laevis TaxID=8355 RepID=A0A974HIR5_XENLA|nr:hypothetical protein XELAEV_18026345mg [Xenopus laevis]